MRGGGGLTGLVDLLRGIKSDEGTDSDVGATRLAESYIFGSNSILRIGWIRCSIMGNSNISRMYYQVRKWINKNIGRIV